MSLFGSNLLPVIRWAILEVCGDYSLYVARRLAKGLSHEDQNGLVASISRGSSVVVQRQMDQISSYTMTMHDVKDFDILDARETSDIFNPKAVILPLVANVEHFSHECNRKDALPECNTQYVDDMVDSWKEKFTEKGLTEFLYGKMHHLSDHSSILDIADFLLGRIF